MKKIAKRAAVLLGSLIGLCGVLFFALAEKDLPKAAVASRYTNAASAFLPMMGMEVHYRDEGVRGDSIPLVLVHGTSASLHTWEKMADLLKQEKRIISMDLPAFGLTGPNPQNQYGLEYYSLFLDSFLTRLNIKQCVLAGNSLGGGIAWNYAVAHPEKVRQLILLDATGFPKKNEKGSLGFKIASLPVVNNLLLYITPKFLVRKSLANVFVDQALVTDTLVNRYHDLLLREGNRGAALAIFKAGYAPNPAAIAKVSCPTLIIWGEKDQLIDVANAALFHRAIRGSSVEILGNTGHVPMEEAPAKVAGFIRGFLRK